MTFVDTSGWYASIVPTDADHARAVGWLAANTGPLLTTDYILDETLTLLRSRGYSHLAVPWGDAVLVGVAADLHYLTAADIAAAWDVFRRFADKDWSFTDCTSKAVMESLASVAYKELKKAGAFVLPGFAKLVVVKKPATPERQGINPFTKEPTVFKAKPARKTLKVRPVKAAKDAV